LDSITGQQDSDALLPPEMKDWGQNNPHVMEHIRKALKEAESPLTEIQIWNLIARTSSPEWTEARARLLRAEQRIAIHESQEYRPLGAIGIALESDSVNEELNNHSLAMAQFTIIDEALREDPDLRRLLAALSKNQRMLEESVRATQEAARMNTVLPAPATTDKSGASALSPLKKAFVLARRMLSGTPAREVTSAPAPSSRGT
jgi:hypothetical protein